MKKNVARVLVSAVAILMVFQSCENEENENETLISTYGSNESHNIGQNCMGCHQLGGSVEGWFTTAGTVYDHTKSSTFPNASIRLYTGPNGTGTLRATVQGDLKGNFYTTEAIDFGDGLYATVECEEELHHMQSPITTGQCNSCHGTSTDRIWTK